MKYRIAILLIHIFSINAMQKSQPKKIPCTTCRTYKLRPEDKLVIEKSLLIHLKYLPAKQEDQENMDQGQHGNAGPTLLALTKQLQNLVIGAGKNATTGTSSMPESYAIHITAEFEITKAFELPYLLKQEENSVQLTILDGLEELGITLKDVTVTLPREKARAVALQKNLEE